MLPAVRALPAFLLLSAAAHADLASDVQRAFRVDEPEQRVVGLSQAKSRAMSADRKERNRAAAEVEKGLKGEVVPSVRNAAYDLLLALGTERSLDRLVVGALDPSEEARAHVQEIVRGHAEAVLHEAILRALKEDASWRMRAAMVDLLLAGARERCRRALLEALADEHPGVRARAAEALFRLTGQPLGLDREKWEDWFAKAVEPPPPGERRTSAEDRVVKVHEGPVRGICPTLYTIPVTEKRVIFVVDMSGSMARTARSDHFEQLKQALFSLPSDVQFNILCFDERRFFFTKAKSLVPATTEAKAEAEKWLNDLPAGGKTDVNAAVTTGLAMLNEALAADAEARAELFLLTDGVETVATTARTAVERQFEKLPAGRCRVHLIALGRGGTPALKTLADLSGGRFVEVPSK
ncbi:MAG: VWA domain-containing protein [Planctomycetota bacterium]